MRNFKFKVQIISISVFFLFFIFCMFPPELSKHGMLFKVSVACFYELIYVFDFGYVAQIYIPRRCPYIYINLNTFSIIFALYRIYAPLLSNLQHILNQRQIATVNLYSKKAIKSFTIACYCRVI